MIVSTATLNPVLGATLRKYWQQQNGFVGRILAPLFLTGQQSAKYYVFGRENDLNLPSGLERAPSTEYPRTKLVLSDDSYACVNRGIEIPIDDEERAKYQDAFSADEQAMIRVRNIVMAGHERRVKDLVTGAGVTQTSAPAVGWDEYADTGSNPILDVDMAKEVIRVQSGVEPNLMVISQAVFDVLKEHPLILAKIVNSERGIVTREILQAIFGIPRIEIAGMVENSANEGQTINPSRVWGDSVIICHSEQAAGMEAPNFARTFVWSQMSGSQGLLVETYREDKIQSDVHRAKQHTDEKLVGPELGYHLSNVLQA